MASAENRRRNSYNTHFQRSHNEGAKLQNPQLSHFLCQIFTDIGARDNSILRFFLPADPGVQSPAQAGQVLFLQDQALNVISAQQGLSSREAGNSLFCSHMHVLCLFSAFFG